MKAASKESKRESKTKVKSTQLVVVSDSDGPDPALSTSMEPATAMISNVDDKNEDDEATKAYINATYQKKTPEQHVLDAPDTYIGSVQKVETDQYIMYPDGRCRIASFELVPGLYKLFDEIIVNSRDQYVKMAQKRARAKAEHDEATLCPVTRIDVTCNQATGEITVFNDGNGIDVTKQEDDLWVPEMVFAHLRTSTNYNKEEENIVGGKNGFGAKLVLIWSTHGSIETYDQKRGLLYFQEFKGNLSTIEPPKITKKKQKPFTRVTFTPDYARMGLDEGLSDKTMALFHRRLYDIAAVTDGHVKVSFNGQPIPLHKTSTISTFERYIDTYSFEKYVDSLPLDSAASDIDADEETQSVVSASNKSGQSGSQSSTKSGKSKALPRALKVYERANDRWEYAVLPSPDGEFRHVSFVNGIFTSKGGKHVDYVIGKIVKKVAAYIVEKKKVDVKPAVIKEQLILFLRCDIINPSFDSQTKDTLTTPSILFEGKDKKYAYMPDVSDAFIEKVAKKLDVMANACLMTEAKNKKSTSKTDGTKRKNVQVEKLYDAIHAGTAKSAQCSLLLCEGDSAKAGVLSGLSRDDRALFGVYPMKGKIMNVREEKTLKVGSNKEISEIKQILGLESNKQYTPEEARAKLRYGRVVFMTDQDLDGSHIKGLGINMFHSLWPTLAQIPGFLSFMNTPILKATKKGGGHSAVTTRVFYNVGEHASWVEEVGEAEAARWSIKYYKGLGTSTNVEFREYFREKKFVEFVHDPQTDNDAIDMVFNKKRADERKAWLAEYDRADYLNTSKASVTYGEFLHKELKHFSIADCDRSIPNAIDGLKTSQRKILFAAFKKNMTKELKVAQFSGYVSEVSGYHHGEASLNSAIVGMAQTFVGSNNINLLEPNGQFGTRLMGGKDSASERYIFTQLNPLTRSLFCASDEGVLRYLEDDGLRVEPDYYLPVLPMLLVNGSSGIGTGYSSDVLPHNVEHLIQHVRSHIVGEDEDARRAMPLDVYYEGFEGEVVPFYKTQTEAEAEAACRYMFVGRYEWLQPNVLHITELPVERWTDAYKQHLDALLEKKEHIHEYVNMSTDTVVDIHVTFLNANAQAELMVPSSKSVGVRLDGSGAWVPLQRPRLEEVMHLNKIEGTSNMHAFDHLGQLRKYGSVHQIIAEHFGVRLAAYDTRRTLLLETLEREAAVLSNKARFILEQLDRKFSVHNLKYDEVHALLEQRGFDALRDGGFAYLVDMTIRHYTREKVDELLKQRDAKVAEHKALLDTTSRQMWTADLDALEAGYTLYKRRRVGLQSRADLPPPASKPSSSAKKAKVPKKKTSSGLMASP